jgi:hypothetical protein
MKHLRNSALLPLLLASATAASGIATAEEKAPALKGIHLAVESEKVPVELEWEQIAGAKLYETEFQNYEGKTLAVFKSPNHTFKFKFKVGRYKVRSRVADARRVFGEWSPLTEFTVQPKPVKLPEKPVMTKGVIDSKTLTSEVVWHWGEAPGATQFRVKVIDQNDQIVRDEVVKGFSYKTQLKAGIYTTTLTSIGADGIESDPVTLPEKVVIETVQLEKPVFVFEEVPDVSDPKVKIQRLPQTKGVPTLRWKDASAVADTVGTLEYRYFFGEEWIPVDKFTSKNAKEVILDKATKPGRYRITAWAESAGLKKSEATTYEFVVKPTSY